MNKAQEVLRKNDPNILSAMEQQAIAFGDYIDANAWIFNPITKVWYSLDFDETFETTSQLYNFFNQQN